MCISLDNYPAHDSHEEVWKSEVFLCSHCADKDKPPEMPIANINNYVVLSRINFPLEQPTDLEVMLMSTVRLYRMVTKVSSRDGKAGLKDIPRVTILYR